MAEGFLMGREMVQQINKLFREWSAQYQNPAGHRGRWQDQATPGCSSRYDLRIHWKPTAGSVIIAVTQYDSATELDVSENITLDWDMTAAEVKAAIELHSVYVAETLTATCDNGPFPSSNIIVSLASGGTMTIVSDTLVRATAAPIPEFRSDLCCTR